ncbi:MAG: DUF1501 domain-containing protein [Acidimicrobiia bacterium]
MLDPDISTADAVRLLHRSEPGGASDPHAMDRRRFLQLVGMGVGAGLVSGGAGSLLDGLGVTGHDPSAWAAGPVGPTDGILVVIGMYGGNNGLNTVVPVNDGRYYDMHGPLAIPAGSTLPLGNGAGLNPHLPVLHEFWTAGRMAIVEGVGYPNPDLSHFNSMGYWMAGRPGGIPSTGWLGRWLDGYLGGGKDLYAATEVGSSVPLHLIGNQQRGTVVPHTRPGYGSDPSPRATRQYDAIRAMRTGAGGPWSGAVGQAFVDQLDLAKTLAPVIPATDQLPDTRIVAQLEVAARLINANLGFRVVTAGFGDFDSHAGQPAQHTARMQELNAAIGRFYATLDPAWHTRVAVMTFSEFGRTPWSNDGAGTDHGTSAPHFVIGHNVKGGWYGQRSTLAGLGRWDRMAHHVDFRSYYATMIDGWLGGGSSDVLGGSFEHLGLFARGPGRLPSGGIAPGPGSVSPSSGFVPLTPTRIVDTRKGLGAPRRKLRPGERLPVRVAGVGGVPATGATAVIANVTAVAPTTNMHFTVYPGSTARPNTSSLNGQPGRPIPNLVVMGVGSDGCIEVFNSHGETHCLVDVFGYATAGGGHGFTPLRPQRLFDSREGLGIGRHRHGGQQPVDIQVAGEAGVPTSGATAVVMNLTATRTSSVGFVRLTPTGTRRADTSNVNFHAGDTVPNLVICQLGTGGKITLDADGDGTHVIGDVFGYFSTGGAKLRSTPPNRVLDTRDGTGAAAAPIGPDRTITLQLAGRHGIPTGATAVVLNLTAARVRGRSFVSVWPAGEDDPGTSNLNVVPGRVSANLVICRLGADGAVTIANPIAECEVIGDVTGYFT